jgi:hypothetical protein
MKINYEILCDFYLVCVLLSNEASLQFCTICFQNLVGSESLHGFQHPDITTGLVFQKFRATGMGILFCCTSFFLVDSLKFEVSSELPCHLSCCAREFFVTRNH